MIKLTYKGFLIWEIYFRKDFLCLVCVNIKLVSLFDSLKNFFSGLMMSADFQDKFPTFSFDNSHIIKNQCTLDNLVQPLWSANSRYVFINFINLKDFFSYFKYEIENNYNLISRMKYVSIKSHFRLLCSSYTLVGDR